MFHELDKICFFVIRHVDRAAHQVFIGFHLPKDVGGGVIGKCLPSPAADAVIIYLDQGEDFKLPFGPVRLYKGDLIAGQVHDLLFHRDIVVIGLDAA